MAEDLLDLARLESGHLAVDPVDTDLCIIIGEAVRAYAARAGDKHITMTMELPGRLGLHADPGRLRRAAASLDDNGQTITWTVADTGIGVPRGERRRLFRRFYRASTALNKRIPGTGVGLVITRTIVERHHGTITLAEHTGPGTTFAVRLPTTSPVV